MKNAPKKKTVSGRLANFGKSLIGWQSIRDGGVFILDMIRAIRHRPEGVVETFEAAYQRNGLDEATLRRIYRNLQLCFYASMGFSAMSLALMAGSLHEPMMGLAYLAFALMTFSFAFKYSFRAYQIRLRRFCSVAEWKANPHEWLPVEMPRRKRVK